MKVTVFVLGAFLGFALGFATPTIIRYAGEAREDSQGGLPRDQTQPKLRLPSMLYESPESERHRTGQGPFQLLPNYVEPDQAKLRVNPSGAAIGAHDAILAGGGCSP